MLGKRLKLLRRPSPVLLAVVIVVGLVALFISVADQSVSAEHSCLSSCQHGTIKSINEGGKHGVIQGDDGALFQFSIPKDFVPGNLGAPGIPGIDHPVTFDPVAPRARKAINVIDLMSPDCPPFC